jgi:potassium intermediate/small conductance calcium-activated channel subfamily N protein 2
MTFITLSTVGYGDVYPYTTLGRVLAFLLCIWGLFLMSIIVIVLFQSLDLTYEEKMCLLVFNKLKIK